MAIQHVANERRIREHMASVDGLRSGEALKRLCRKLAVAEAFIATMASENGGFARLNWEDARRYPYLVDIPHEMEEGGEVIFRLGEKVTVA